MRQGLYEQKWSCHSCLLLSKHFIRLCAVLQGYPHIALLVALQTGLHVLQALDARVDGGVVDHVLRKGAGLLGRHALGKAVVQVAHGLQPALGVAGGEPAVLGRGGSDRLVAPLDGPGDAVLPDEGDLLAPLLVPEDGPLGAVDAQA